MQMVGITSETSEEQGSSCPQCMRRRTCLKSSEVACISTNMDHESLDETSLSFRVFYPNIFVPSFLAPTNHSLKSQRTFKKKTGTPRVESGRCRPHASYAPVYECCPFLSEVESTKTAEKKKRSGNDTAGELKVLENNLDFFFLEPQRPLRRPASPQSSFLEAGVDRSHFFCSGRFFWFEHT